MKNPIRFGVLGPALLRDNRGEFIYPTGREARLLVLLLVNAGRPVAADHLMEVVWEDELPASPDSAIHNVVYRLRRFLSDHGYPDLVEKGPAGYVLVADPLQIDSHRFEWLVGEAAGRDRSAARELMVEGLALWRGEPFQGIATTNRRLEAEARRLNALRWVALEGRIACDLADSMHRELIPELVALTTQAPLRENLWACLMAALYFSGNQGRALRAYRRARGVLTGEYGIEPSQSLRELEEAILGQDDARVQFLSHGSVTPVGTTA